MFPFKVNISWLRLLCVTDSLVKVSLVCQTGNIDCDGNFGKQAMGNHGKVNGIWKQGFNGEAWIPNPVLGDHRQSTFLLLPSWAKTWISCGSPRTTLGNSALADSGGPAIKLHIRLGSWLPPIPYNTRLSRITKYNAMNHSEPLRDVIPSVFLYTFCYRPPPPAQQILQILQIISPSGGMAVRGQGDISSGSPEFLATALSECWGIT